MSCKASLLLLALRSVCPIGSPRVQSRQSKVTHFVSLVGDDAEEHFVGTNQSSDETRRFSRWTTVTSLSLVWDPTRVSRPLFASRYLNHFLQQFFERPSWALPSFSIRVHNCSSLISKEPVSRFLLLLSLKISSMLWLAVVIKLEVDFLLAFWRLFTWFDDIWTNEKHGV